LAVADGQRHILASASACQRAEAWNEGRLSTTDERAWYARLCVRYCGGTNQRLSTCWSTLLVRWLEHKPRSSSSATRSICDVVVGTTDMIPANLRPAVCQYPGAADVIHKMLTRAVLVHFTMNAAPHARAAIIKCTLSSAVVCHTAHHSSLSRCVEPCKRSAQFRHAATSSAAGGIPPAPPAEQCLH
jgi:hypothetical protein